MLNSLQAIAELLRVFSFSLLAITVGVVGYALLQVCVHGAIGQREARDASDDANETCEDRERGTSANWRAFTATPQATTGFTRHAKH
jgi:hypothetical protein